MTQCISTTIDKFYLNRKDIEKLNTMLNKFPSVDFFTLEQERGSGIGNIIKISFDLEINGTKGLFTSEVSGVEDW